MPKISVFGASGRTGSLVVKEALGRGYIVTAFCRDSASVSQFPEGVKKVVGILNDVNAVSNAIEDSDAVVCVFGQRASFDDVFCAIATETILQSMHALGVRRLLCVTGAMVGDYPQIRSFFFNKMAKAFTSRRPEIAKDRSLQERLVMESDTDWTIVKPPRLTDSSAKGSYRVGNNLQVGMFSKLTRSDLARFLLDEIKMPKYVRQFIVVKN